MATWFVSNCHSNRRWGIMAWIYRSQFIAVHFGRHLRRMRDGSSEEMSHQSTRLHNPMLNQYYRFYFCFENSLCCPDYITEKCYRPLAFDTVPVVYVAWIRLFIVSSGRILHQRHGLRQSWKSGELSQEIYDWRRALLELLPVETEICCQFCKKRFVVSIVWNAERPTDERENVRYCTVVVRWDEQPDLHAEEIDEAIFRIWSHLRIHTKAFCPSIAEGFLNMTPPKWWINSHEEGFVHLTYCISWSSRMLSPAIRPHPRPTDSFYLFLV